jgi:hypothetical protein
MPLYRHKKFLFFFKTFIRNLYPIFFNVFNIKGFFFDIRGKVGVAGNSKKRHYCFHYGLFGKSTTSIKMDIEKTIVRTNTGVLGMTMIITF